MIILSCYQDDFSLGDDKNYKVSLSTDTDSWLNSSSEIYWEFFWCSLVEATGPIIFMEFLLLYILILTMLFKYFVQM